MWLFKEGCLYSLKSEHLDYISPSHQSEQRSVNIAIYLTSCLLMLYSCLYWAVQNKLTSSLHTTLHICNCGRIKFSDSRNHSLYIYTVYVSIVASAHELRYDRIKIDQSVGTTQLTPESRLLFFYVSMYHCTLWTCCRI